MKLEWFLLFILVLLGGLSLTAAPHSVVSIRPYTTVSRGLIHLSDVVDMMPFPKHVRDVELIRFLKVGETHEWSRSDFTKMLRDVGFKTSDGIQFVIPESVTVQVGLGKFSVSTLKSKLKEMVQAQDCNCEVEVELTQIPDLKQIPIDSEWKLSSLMSTKGTTPFAVDFYQAEGRTQKLWFRAEIKWFANVPVSTKVLLSGSRISESDYTFKKKEITYLRDLIQQSQNIKGSRLKRNVQPQEILSLQNIEFPRLVNAGEDVSVKFSSGGLQMTLKTLAQQAGNEGDLINVLNPLNRKVLKVRVVSQGLAEVQ